MARQRTVGTAGGMVGLLCLSSFRFGLNHVWRPDQSLFRATPDVDDNSPLLLLWANATKSPYTELIHRYRTENSQDHRRPCRVVLENKPDWHYELFESVILRYPLPWHEFNCSISKPVRFDVAHNDKGWFSEGELEGWREYFDKHLKGTVRERTDGVSALFHNATFWSDHERQKIPYDAYIGVSCGSHPTKKYVDRGEDHFCLLHIDCALDSYCNQTHLLRSCRPNPVDDECSFLPVDFPRFDSETSCHPRSSSDQHTTNINLCTSGGARQHLDMAGALEILLKTHPELLTNVSFLVHQRKGPYVPKQYNETGTSQFVRVVREGNFLKFQRSIAQCDVMLPLVNPQSNTGYFLKSTRLRSNGEPLVGAGGQLTGSIAQAIGYQLPTVLHADLKTIYSPYLAAPSLTYYNAETFRAALIDMLQYLRSEVLPKKRRCLSFLRSDA